MVAGCYDPAVPSSLFTSILMAVSFPGMSGADLSSIALGIVTVGLLVITLAYVLYGSGGRHGNYHESKGLRLGWPHVTEKEGERCAAVC